MEVRFTYRAEIYLQGKSLKDIKKQWESLSMDEIGENSNFIEVVSVEDADTYDDIMYDFITEII